MTLKQLAERLGVPVKDLAFELDGGCKDCKKTGGSSEPCERGDCVVVASITVVEAQA
jgi:hypothetical protein